jgi:hypothetical protein
MTTRSFLLRCVTGFISIAGAASAMGCGADFDSPDKVDSMRVFAVQKDPPYAPPTIDPMSPSVVNLSMLWTPGPHHTQDEVQRIWFSGCDDLPGDQYFTCLLYMHYMWKFYTWGGNSDRALPAENQTWSPVDDTDHFPEFKDFIKAQFPELLAAIVAEATTQGVDPELAKDQAITFFLSTWRIGAGSNYKYVVPPGIIERHPPSTDPSIPRYGVGFIFFTACAGHIEPAPSWDAIDSGAKLTDATLGFPFNCVDDTTGAQLGPEDFVSGYTQQFVYGDGSTNNNPIIGAEGKSAMTFDGKDVNTAAYCLDGACDDSLTSGPANPPLDVPEGICTNDTAQVFPHVKKCSGKCPTYDYTPTLDPAKNNDDTRFGKPQSADGFKREQMWINYYADKGSLKHTVRLLQDATEGWNSGKFDNTWTPPTEAGPVNFWSVVHDVRGGASWIRFLVCVDD